MLKTWTPYLVVLCLLFGGMIAHREVRDRGFDRRIYFVQGQGLYYILAREYRSHYLMADKIILVTDRESIEVDNHPVTREGITWRRGECTLEKIDELKKSGVIHAE